MFIYHYHATRQIKPGEIVNIDGIATLASPVRTMDDYHELKRLVINDATVHPSIFTICSLSLLEET